MASPGVSGRVPTGPDAARQALADPWLRAAEQDYRLCRAFADRFSASLPRSLRSQRLGWEYAGAPGYALLVPDILPATSPKNDEWYLYSVTGQTLFHWTRAQRVRMKALVLADCVEDWAELLRQAVHDHVFDVRYEVTPQYLSPLGEYELTRPPSAAGGAWEAQPSGYLFSLGAHAPPNATAAPFHVHGSGETPEGAARDACLCWLKSPPQGPCDSRD